MFVGRRGLLARQEHHDDHDEHARGQGQCARQDADRDNWMSPQDAVEYGMIDRILLSRKEVSKNLPEIPSTTEDQRVVIEETPKLGQSGSGGATS